MPARSLTPLAEASFVAYLHYAEDLAGVVSGRFGGVDGVFETLRLHPPVRELPPRELDAADTHRWHRHLSDAWTRLALIDNAISVADRQANAVVPALAVQAALAAGRSLGVALGAEDVETDDDVFALLGDAAAEELFPYPWSAFCEGCPQMGTTLWGGGVLPGDPVSIFATPQAATSDARVAMLLRTTRQRVVERAFAIERQTDVRPGRSRRNLTRDHKEAVASRVPPTTLYDVLDRMRLRVEEDDGVAFVDAPYDDTEALRLAEAVAFVADASVAVIEGVGACVVGWDLYTDLLAAHARRAPAAPSIQRRLTAARVG